MSYVFLEVNFFASNMLQLRFMPERLNSYKRRWPTFLVDFCLKRFINLTTKGIMLRDCRVVWAFKRRKGSPAEVYLRTSRCSGT